MPTGLFIWAPSLLDHPLKLLHSLYTGIYSQNQSSKDYGHYILLAATSLLKEGI
jgi:hypothetical protein